MPDVYLLSDTAPEAVRAAVAIWLEHHGVDPRHVVPGARITLERDRGWVEAYVVEAGEYVLNHGERVVCDQVFALHAAFPAAAGEELRLVGTGTPP